MSSSCNDLGGEYGAAGASFYVIAYALAECALFPASGVVAKETGEDRLSMLGDLRKPLSILAAASGAEAAGIAAFPLTVGFFRDELFFKAAPERGPVFAGLAAFGTVLTFAHVWRFWSGIFLGEPRDGAGCFPAAR